MSGHSKWSTIKHGKAVTDARRGQLFTKLAREIIVAARQGGGNSDSNFRLRMAIQRARDNNMPVDNIDRAIKRGSGSGDQAQMTEATYEGYGPGGAAILLQALTDNRNRTASDVRSTFSKGGGNLSESGSVAWQFEQSGVIVVEEDEGDRVEELTLAAIDAGAEDFEAFDSTLHVFSAPDRMEDVRKRMAEFDANVTSSELSMLPKSTVTLEEKAARQTLRLLDRLEELDDIQRVFSNADFPDDVLREYRDEA